MRKFFACAVVCSALAAVVLAWPAPQPVLAAPSPGVEQTARAGRVWRVPGSRRAVRRVLRRARFRPLYGRQVRFFVRPLSRGAGRYALCFFLR